MNKLEKMAAKDAYDYGFAQMFFGDGAGVMRRHLDAKVGDRIRDIPGYEMAFETASARLNQTELAEKALAHRKKLDRAAKAGKNLRALKSGNVNNLTTGVFVVVGVAYLAHQTGYDKKAEVEVKKLWKRAKDEYTVRKDGRRIRLMREGVYGVTNIHEKPKEDPK